MNSKQMLEQLLSIESGLSNWEVEFIDSLANEKEEFTKKQKEKLGGPNYFLLQLNRNSRLFTQTVLDAFRGGVIEPSLASNLLNVQVNKFSKLEAQMYR
mgnify:CR=1 FL=1